MSTTPVTTPTPTPDDNITRMQEQADKNFARQCAYDAAKEDAAAKSNAEKTRADMQDGIIRNFKP